MTTRSPVPNPAGFVRGIVGACVAHDPPRTRDELDQAVEAMGVGGCFDEVLFPALRRIGCLWRSGDLEIEAERLTSETVRAWLEAQALRAPEPTEAAPLLLACGPADRHSIGLEALGVLLRNEQRRCRVLGARTSVGALVTAVRANQPGAVVIASHLPANRLSATLSLRAAAALGPEVFYAGSAFASARLRRHVPGTHLDTTLQGARDVILGAASGSTRLSDDWS